MVQLKRGRFFTTGNRRVFLRHWVIRRSLNGVEVHGDAPHVVRVEPLLRYGCWLDESTFDLRPGRLVFVVFVLLFLLLLLFFFFFLVAALFVERIISLRRCARILRGHLQVHVLVSKRHQTFNRLVARPPLCRFHPLGFLFQKVVNRRAPSLHLKVKRV